MTDEQIVVNAAAKISGEVFTLEIGYSKKRSEHGTFRTMSADEVMSLSAGSRVWFRALDGTARQLTINGKIRVWKREPNRVEIPIKYGLREYGVFDMLSAQDRLLIKLD